MVQFLFMKRHTNTMNFLALILVELTLIAKTIKNHIVQTAGRISGDIAINFYNLDGQLITTADLNFVVEYQASNTKVTATITNVGDSVSYLNTYMEINGAILRVVNQEIAV